MGECRDGGVGVQGWWCRGGGVGECRCGGVVCRGGDMEVLRWWCRGDGVGVQG